MKSIDRSGARYPRTCARQPRAVVQAAAAAFIVLLFAALLVRAPAAQAQATECARLLPGPTGETLVNQCNVCRTVSLLRSRVGNANPTQRSFTLHPGIPVAVPFKGSGRSRIVSDTPCEGAPGGPVNIVNPKAQAAPPSEPICVNLYRVGGQILMLNACEACRQVTVARTGQGGGEARVNYILNGKSRLPLDPLGAASARLVGEARCAG